MGLTNSQANQIKRKYELAREKNQAIIDSRRDEVYSKIPELSSIDDAIVDASRDAILKKLSGKNDAADMLHQTLDSLQMAKDSLLKENGYPVNYLEPIFDCPDCRDTGLINGKKCHCYIQSSIDLVYAQSNIKQVLEEENFSTYTSKYYRKDVYEFEDDSPYNYAKKAYEEAMEFVQHFNDKGGNLLLCGNSGTGKTFLTHCISKELLDKGVSVLYFSATQFFRIYEKICFERDYNETFLEDNISTCDLLIIDDLGTEFSSTFTISKLFDCLNDRLINHKSTIISTNLTITELVDKYSERITSRVFSNYKALKFTGEDIRLKKSNN